MRMKLSLRVRVRARVLAVALASPVLFAACAADPSPPGAPPMTFAYGCTRASECPLTQPTMLGSTASVTMIVHGEPEGAKYTLRADLDKVFVNAHTSTCGCAADDLATSSGSCPEGKANVCAHRFVAQGLAEGDTPIDVMDGDRVVASAVFRVRRAASVDVSVLPADAARDGDGAYMVKPGDKLTVTPQPRSADGALLRFGGSAVSFTYTEDAVVVHDSVEPGAIEVARAVSPGTAAITVSTGDAKHDFDIRVVAP
jgi:hypothetical protein